MSDDNCSEGRERGTVVGGPLDSERAPVTPTMDVVFDVLADDDRRRVCLYLTREDPEAITVEEIVAAVAEDCPDAEQERLAIDLHHRHLPKLSAAGIIDYDPRSNTARYWGQPTVEKWARHVREQNKYVSDEP
jgi:hypothetical protein